MTVFTIFYSFPQQFSDLCLFLAAFKCFSVVLPTQRQWPILFNHDDLTRTVRHGMADDLVRRAGIEPLPTV